MDHANIIFFMFLGTSLLTALWRMYPILEEKITAINDKYFQKTIDDVLDDAIRLYKEIAEEEASSIPKKVEADLREHINNKMMVCSTAILGKRKIGSGFIHFLVFFLFAILLSFLGGVILCVFDSAYIFGFFIISIGTCLFFSIINGGKILYIYIKANVTGETVIPKF